MKRFFLPLILLLLLAGCRPEGVLSSRKMQDVLYDLHRTEGILQVKGYNYGHETDLAGYYHSVLQSHGVTQAQFDSSLVWYTNHPERFDKIYPKVVERFQKEIDKMDAERDASVQLQGSNDLAILPVAGLDSLPEPTMSLEKIQQITRYGYANPWQIWTPQVAPDSLLMKNF